MYVLLKGMGIATTSYLVELSVKSYPCVSNTLFCCFVGQSLSLMAKVHCLLYMLY